MQVATKVLNLLAALILVMTGFYVMVQFGDLFSSGWKTMLTGSILTYVVVQVADVFRRRMNHETDNNLYTNRLQLFP